MPVLHRIVVDTNVFVSALLLPRSIPRQAIEQVLDNGVLLFSEATMDGVAEVLWRPKFDSYMSAEDRTILLGRLSAVPPNSFLLFNSSASAAILRMTNSWSGAEWRRRFDPHRRCGLIDAPSLARNWDRYASGLCQGGRVSSAVMRRSCATQTKTPLSSIP